MSRIFEQAPVDDIFAVCEDSLQPASNHLFSFIAQEFSDDKMLFTRLGRDRRPFALHEFFRIDAVHFSGALKGHDALHVIGKEWHGKGRIAMSWAVNHAFPD